jgi:hypothetical protein
MKYPKLVRRQDCTTPCAVTLFAEGINEDGERVTAFEGAPLCCLQSSSKRVRTAKHDEVTLTAEVFFCEDFCPALAEIPDGEITVHGIKRRIVTGMKARNPDGSVNYIRLGVV